MPGGRRQPLARAIAEYGKRQADSADPGSISFDDVLAEVSTPGVSRRDVLRAGGLLGAGLAIAGVSGNRALAAASPHPATDTPSRRSAPDAHAARVVVVGAGLAGLTAAYQLDRLGIHVEVFEARHRIGGRCWSSRGWEHGQIAEHGGEFIDSRHVHLLQMAHQLHLKLDDLWKGWVPGSVWLNYVDGQPVDHKALSSQLDPVIKQIIADAKRLGVIGPGHKPNDIPYSFGTATRESVGFDQMSMRDWLDLHFPGVADSTLGHYLDEIMCAWYGGNLTSLSAINWIDYFVIPYPGGDERWHIRGGNDLVVHGMARHLPDGAIHMEAPLEAITRRSDGGFRLRFGGRSRAVTADFVVLALPFTTLKDVDLSRAGLTPRVMKAVQSFGMGDDSKVLLQFDQRFDSFQTAFGPWSGGMEHAGPNFETWESSTDERGTAGLLTVYPGGKSARNRFAAPGLIHGECPAPLRDATLGWLEAAVPGVTAHFNGMSWVDWWPGDPWTKGSYAAFGPGQTTKYWKGVGKAIGRLHFAGEHTSTYSQGFLNGGVESGDRAAIEIMRTLGIPAPASLASLPYSTFG